MLKADKAVKVIRAILGGAAVAAIMSGPAHGIVIVFPEIGIEKSINGADADTQATALNVAVGDPLTYVFLVQNTGGVDLTNIFVTDSEISLAGCSFPTDLSPGQSVTCTLTGFVAVAGLHSDFATATGTAAIDTFNVGSTVVDPTVSDTDFAFYDAAAPGVPEPATLALLGLGLAGLGFSRRRKLN